MASTPSYDPNLLASHDINEQQTAWKQLTAENNGDPLINRAIAGHLPARFDATRSSSRRPRSPTARPRTRQYTAAGSIPLPGTNRLPAAELQRPARAAAARRRRWRPHSPSRATRRSVRWPAQLGENKLHGAGGQVRLQRRRPARCRCRSRPRRLGPIPDERRALPERHRPARRAHDAAAERDDRGDDRQRRQADAAVPGVEDPRPGPRSRSTRPTPTRSNDRDELGQRRRTLRDMMIQSEINTGGEGRLPNVQVASKTGTAEVGGTDARRPQPPHAWYIAFAPAQKPEIAIAVIVENGGDRGLGATGGKVAAPIGRAVMNAYLAGSLMLTTGQLLADRYRLSQADRGRRHGRGLGSRGRPARPPRRREGAQGRALRRPRVPAPVPRRGADDRVAQPPRHRVGARLRRDRVGRRRAGGHGVPGDGARRGRTARDDHLAGAGSPPRSRWTCWSRPATRCRPPTNAVSCTAT